MACPVCGEDRSSVLWTASAEEVTRMALVAEREPERAAALQREIERLWGGPDCRFRRCDACGFEFADPYVAGDEAFYGLLYEDFHYGGHAWDWDRTRTRLAELLEGEAPAAHRLLEVGAGGGHFLRRVVPSLLPPERVLCTEFNPAALERLRALGVQAVASDFRDLADPAPGEAFSFVCLFHVLEHLDGLDRGFERLGALTRPDARVFVSLPNPRNAAFHEERGVHLEWPPHHIGRWPRSAFDAIGKRHGFEVVDHAAQPVGRGELLRAFAGARFVQAGRRPGSVAARVRAIGRRPLRLAASAPLVALEGLRALPRVPLGPRPDLGRSHWVELRRVRGGGARGSVGPTR